MAKAIRVVEDEPLAYAGGSRTFNESGPMQGLRSSVSLGGVGNWVTDTVRSIVGGLDVDVSMRDGDVTRAEVGFDNENTSVTYQAGVPGVPLWMIGAGVVGLLVLLYLVLKK